MIVCFGVCIALLTQPNIASYSSRARLNSLKLSTYDQTCFAIERQVLTLGRNCRAITSKQALCCYPCTCVLEHHWIFLYSKIKLNNLFCQRFRDIFFSLTGINKEIDSKTFGRSVVPVQIVYNSWDWWVDNSVRSTIIKHHGENKRDDIVLADIGSYWTQKSNLRLFNLAKKLLFWLL